MNAQSHNQGHFLHHNPNDPVPPYQLEPLNSPGQQQSPHIEVTGVSQPTTAQQRGKLQKRQQKGKPNSPPPTYISIPSPNRVMYAPFDRMVCLTSVR